MSVEGMSTVVSDGKTWAESSTLSMPATDICPGTAMPRARHSAIAPMAMTSTAPMIAVGRSASSSRMPQPTRPPGTESGCSVR
jgi:hypothetical protein